MPPLTPFQRFVAHLMPWYDPAEQEARIRRTEAVRRHVIGVRIRAEHVERAYHAAGERMHR